MTPRHVVTAEEAHACAALMRQLRPHLIDAADFVARWRRQTEAGYRLIAIWDDHGPIALAGFRITENLVHGRHLYVDDLVTDATHRGSGLGHRLMDHLKGEARAERCAKLILDTPRTNTDAHRFYEREGLTSSSVRYAIVL
jgi:GNAT superfamily N-acetyltransferase